MKRLPKKKYWYHGCSVETAKQILEDGVLRDMSGLGLYFANRRDYAGTFGAIGDWQAKQQGKDSLIAVFKIPASRIDNLELGTDHAPHAFPQDLITAVSHGAQISVTVKDIHEVYSYPTRETA